VQLVADRRDEALAQLVERVRGAEVAEDRGRPDAALPRQPGRITAGGLHRAPRPADRGLAVSDRDAGPDRLCERAIRDAVSAGRLAAERVPAAPTESVGSRQPQQALRGRVQPRDPAGLVDLDDHVCGAVDDRGEIVPLALERLAQAGAGERDRQLVPSQLGDPDSVLVEGAPVGRPDGDDHGRRLVGPDHDAQVDPPARPRPRRRGIVQLGGQVADGADLRGQLERAAGSVAEPDRALVAGGEAGELEEDGASELGEDSAGGHELAELVLREQRVGLALGVLEGPSRLVLQARDPRLEAGSVPVGQAGAGSFGHRPARARRIRKHETAPGSRWPAERSPRRRAMPRRAINGRVESIPRRDASIVIRAASLAGAPVETAAPSAAAAGRRESRIVLSPTAHRPRRARPSVAASSIAAASGPSITDVLPARKPASMKAVP